MTQLHRRSIFYGAPLLLLQTGCEAPPAYFSPDPLFSPEERSQVIGAIEVWRAACPLYVPPVDETQPPNVFLDCERAHAYHPEAVAMTFARSQIFICPDPPGRDPPRRADLIFVTMLHELGHVFGLPHSAAKDSVMQAGEGMSTWQLPVVPSEEDTAFCR